jgi:hypothetical protein
MKKRLYFITTALAAMAALSLSSCLKDPRYVNFGQGGTVVNFPKGGLAFFSADAITDANDTIVKQFAVELASPTVPSSSSDVTIAVDNSIIATYETTNNSVDYLTMPDGSYKLSATKVTIPAGQRSAAITVTFYKALLDPSKSYMLPIKIVSGPSGATISGNMGIHYYHFIGNDFAGTYHYDYRRWQNGTGPGAGIIPSQSSAGVPPDITNSPGENVVISPVSPTEFQMVTDYNGQGVNYDVTFTKTGTGASATYSNWSVQFLPGDLQKWSDAGITNMLAPAFVIPPPATATDPKIFELRYVSGGAHGRYIDDTYIKE